jgi:hypothetical protein
LIASYVDVVNKLGLVSVVNVVDGEQVLLISARTVVGNDGACVVNEFELVL